MVKFSSMVVLTKLPPHCPAAPLNNDPSQIPSSRQTHNFAHMANGCDSFFSSRHLSPSSPDLSWKAVEVATEHSRS